MIHYLETIIVQSVDFITAKAGIDLPNTPPSAKGPETDAEFHAKLSADSNIIACKCYGGPHGRNHIRYDIEREDGRVICTDAAEH